MTPASLSKPPSASPTLPRNACAHSWLPHLVRTRAIAPTILVPCQARPVQKAARRGDMRLLANVCRRAEQAAQRIGYPVYVRNEAESLPENVAVAHDESDLARAVASCVLSPRASDSCHLVIRKHLPMTAPLVAPDGQSVRREFIVHAQSGVARCIHPAWTMAPAGGEAVFSRLFALSVDDQEALTRIARSGSLRGGWRLNVAQAPNGSWLVLDAGRAKMCRLPKTKPTRALL